MLWKKGKHSKLTVRMTHVALLKLLLSKTFTKEASQELFACSFCVKLCVESHCANRSGSIAPASVEGEWVFYLDSISSHFIHHYDCSNNVFPSASNLNIALLFLFCLLLLLKTPCVSSNMPSSSSYIIPMNLIIFSGYVYF